MAVIINSGVIVIVAIIISLNFSHGNKTMGALSFELRASDCDFPHWSQKLKLIRK